MASKVYKGGRLYGGSMGVYEVPKIVAVRVMRKGLCSVGEPKWSWDLAWDFNERVAEAHRLLKDAGLFVKTDYVFKSAFSGGPSGMSDFYGPVESVVAVLRMNGFEVIQVGK